MPRTIDDIVKELSKITKEISGMENKFSKELSDIKRIMKYMNLKIDDIANKVQEFEIIMDAAEIIEDHIEEEENKYNSEWDPEEDESDYYDSLDREEDDS